MKKESKINAVWHKAHRMPKNPTIDQRIDWHLDHLKNCNCRTELPKSIKDEMKKRKIAIPS